MPFSKKKKGSKISWREIETDNLPNRKNPQNQRIIPRARTCIKTEAINSFSIPSKLRKKTLCTNNLSTLRSRQQDKKTCDEDGFVTDSTNDDPEKDPDWHSSYSLEQLQSSDVDLEKDLDDETYDSVEQLRSSDVDLEKDLDDETYDSVEQLRSSEFSEFAYQEASPISSTPFSLLKEKCFHFPDLAVPDVSYIKVPDYKDDTLAVVNFHSKSNSSKKIIELPDISDDVLREYAEQDKDFVTNLEVPVSNGFDFPGTSNETLELNFTGEHFGISFDDEDEENYSLDEYVEQISDHVYSEHHFDRDHSEKSFDRKDLTVIKNSSDVKHQKKKRNNKVKNFSKNIYSSSSEDSFEDNQNTKINMPEQKRTFYRDSIGINKSKLRRKIPLKKTIEKDSFEYMNNSYAENNLENVQNIQNEGGHSDKIDNSRLKTVLHQHERKKNNQLGVGYERKKDPINVRDESQHSYRGIRNHKDIENLNHEYNDPNFSYECGAQNFGKDSDEEDRATVIKSSLSATRQNKQQKNKVGNFSGKMDSYNNGIFFKDNRNTQTDTPKKKGNFYRGVLIKSNRRLFKPLRSTSKEENFSPHINKSDTKNKLVNVQNIQDEDRLADKLDNNRPKTISYQTGRKIKVGYESQPVVVSVLNDSQYFNQKTRMHMNGQNSGNDNLNYDSVNNLEAPNIKIESSVKKRKNYKNSRFEPSNPISRSKNTINSLSGMQQDVDSIPNEPQCSKLEMEKLKNSLEKSGEDNFEYDSKQLLEDQNIQTDFKGKKGRSVRGVGKRCNHGNRSKAATVQKNKNKARKHTWPICCIKAMSPEYIKILKPVIREDVPIDCITLMYLEDRFKRNCQHC